MVRAQSGGPDAVADAPSVHGEQHGGTGQTATVREDLVDDDGLPASRDGGRLDELAREALTDLSGAMPRFLLAISPAIRRACRGVLGARHPDLEDTVQECLLIVARALPRYRLGTNLFGYVTKIAVRHALASRRRDVVRVRHLRVLEDMRQDLPAGRADGRESEGAGMVRDLIRRVHPTQAETLILRVVLGFSVEEIAVMTEVSVNTVKTRLRLGKDALRRLLARTTGQTRGRTGSEPQR